MDFCFISLLFPPLPPRQFVFKIAGYSFLILMHPHEDGTREERTSDNQREEEKEEKEASEEGSENE